ncbi:MAG: exodeoxyribonuclease III [Bacteroidales bacterium]|nr:exodeoxyribonuclease III [Bacteroidales bacterium]
MKRIVSYNVNGIRAAIKKGFLEWLQAVNADIILLQEIKAAEDQIPVFDLQALGYEIYCFSAQKKGYSGVAILTRIKPDHIEYGMGIEKYDFEGRMIRADFGDLSVASIYHPSGSSGEERLAFKMQWLSDFQDYIIELRETRPNLVLSGDYNICHEAIDIHDPIRNKTVSGFLPEERAWLSGFMAKGFIDSFRHLNKEPHNYSWWSYRANARNNNKGWRIDYHMVSEHMEEKISRAVILPEAKHSDHCPVLVEIDN